MHRLILSSATYGQSAAEHDPVGLEKDPQNQWLWHQQRHRLGAEELRDSLLAVSGRLDRTLGGDSVADVLNPRRSLYLTTVRSERSSFLLLFDGADPTSIVEQRNESTVAPQALWLLNHPLVLAQAQQLAERVLVTVQPLEMLYQQVFQRAPTAAEVSAAAPWVAAKDYASLAQVLMCSNEFIYLD